MHVHVFIYMFIINLFIPLLCLLLDKNFIEDRIVLAIFDYVWKDDVGDFSLLLRLLARQIVCTLSSN